MDYKVKKIEEMGRCSAEEFHQMQKRPFVVVLDNVRSQHNVGAVFRTADAFALEAVCLCGICPPPDSVEVHKTALGAEKTVDYIYYKDTREAVEALHERGYRVYAIEQCHNSITLSEAVARLQHERENAEGKERGGIAVILGHEVFGVNQEVVNLCDGCIEIPQYGTKHSLNVSVTAGIVLYELSTHLA